MHILSVLAGGFKEENPLTFAYITPDQPAKKISSHCLYHDFCINWSMLDTVPKLIPEICRFAPNQSKQLNIRY